MDELAEKLTSMREGHIYYIEVEGTHSNRSIIGEYMGNVMYRGFQRRVFHTEFMYHMIRKQDIIDVKEVSRV